ncbi:MAG TPA: amidase [Acidisphaera sp.]|nr:amidase [Acidisphaera sp.]
MHADEEFCCSKAAIRIDVAERQLTRLAAREPDIRAFACVDPAGARYELAGPPVGPLSGALVGIKDIIATADFPTRCGDDPATGEPIPRIDAWVVARLKSLGATILGKTACTRFGVGIPGPTRNPHDPSRTPGGSSSGSAAAVAAGFCSFAIGTQTAGSTIRPASYCGVVGFKPSFGLLSTEGIRPLSTTLDHVGIFATSPRDAWYLTSALVLDRPRIAQARRPARILVLQTPPEIAALAEYQEPMSRLCEDLRADGVDLEMSALPFPPGDFAGLQKDLCYWEAARILLGTRTSGIADELRAAFEPYLRCDVSFHASAQQRRLRYQAEFQSLASRFDAVLLPAATGSAPPFADTGDAVMNRFWTALHVPVFAVPLWTAESGMPLGLQVIGRLGSDEELAQTAQWLFEQQSQAEGRTRTGSA